MGQQLLKTMKASPYNKVTQELQSGSDDLLNSDTIVIINIIMQLYSKERRFTKWNNYLKEG